MKYNGKEVTGEFTDAIFEKLTDIPQGSGAITRYLVRRVLQASEEVWKERFELGDNVRHKTKDVFGKGVVIEVSADNKTAVVKFPEYNGKRSAWEDAYVGHFKTYDLINLTYKEDSQ